MSFITEAGQFSLTGNVGGAILPVLDNISILGSGTIVVTGDPVLGTLTISGGGVTGMTEHAMVVGNAAGGITSLAVATDGQIPIGSTGNDVVLSTLTAGNNIGITNAAGSITIKVNGTTNHALQIGNATGDLTSLAVGSTGVILQGVVGADPSWSTATYPSTVALGDVLVASTANVIGVVNDVTNAGYVLTANVGAAPSFQALPAGVTYASDAETIAGTVTNKAVAPSNLKAKLGTQTLHGLPIGASDSVAIAWTAEPTDGQILIGKTGNQPVLATISSGNNITATAGAGTISIAVTGTTQHAVQVGGASGQLASLAVGTTGKYLRAVTTADPAWSTLTLPDTVTKGDVLVASADNVVGSVAGATTAGHVLMANGAGSAPTFQALPAAPILSVSGTANQITASTVAGAVTLSTPATFIAPGTIAATTTVTAGTGITITTGDLTFTNNPSATNARIIINGKTWFSAYDSTGSYWTNMFWGYQSGSITGTGVANVGYGANTLKSLTSGGANCAFGLNCLQACTTGSSNIAVSNSALYALTSGNNNTVLGPWAPMGSITTGSCNVVIGTTSVAVSGSNNYGSGYLCTGSDSNNILINNRGSVGLNNTLKIGDGTGTGTTELNASYICGIYGRTPAGTLNVALIDSNNQLGSVASLGVAQGGTGAATLTDHGVLLGSGTGAITPTAVGATGEVLIGNTGADASWSASPTVTTMYATTFDTNVAAAGVTLAGTTLAADGSDTDINITLTPKGTGSLLSLPAYSKAVGATANVMLIDSTGLMGGLAGSANTIFVGGTKPSFTATPQCTDLTLTGNLLLPSSTSTTGQIKMNNQLYLHSIGSTQSVYLGYQCGNSTISGASNTGMGYLALKSLTSGDNNTAQGLWALYSCTTGKQNCAVFTQSLYQITGGSYNIGIGYGGNYGTYDTGSGSQLTGNDSYNICIGHGGVAGSNNVMRLGLPYSAPYGISSTYIAGIYGVTPGGTLNVALIDSNHKLGSVASLGVAQGGTGAATLTDHGILLGSGTGAITPLGEASNGQLPIGSTGADPVLATLTAGTGISVTNGAGSISIAATGTILAWSEITAATKTIVVQEAYVANRGTLITFTLPAAAAVGTEFKIQGKGAGGWKIAQGAGQQIYLGSTATSSGAGGYLEATDAHDAITLVCITADTVWATEAVVGNITVA